MVGIRRSRLFSRARLSGSSINLRTLLNQSHLLQGLLCALMAGLLWGLVFIAPLLLPQYPAFILSASRYFAFGMLCVGLAWFSRRALQTLTRTDWLEAAKLSLVGNLVYYSLLAAAIQISGAPVPTMIIGTLPVVIAVCSNLGEKTIAWGILWQPLILIAAGVALVQVSELRAHGAGLNLTGSQWWGIGLAVGAVACWTWYPIRNARWLKAKPHHQSATWATAQGLVTLPLASLMLLAGWVLAQTGWLPGLATYAWPLGSDPLKFVGLMLAIGLLASWLGTLLWNRASKLLPTALGGQLIVFETLAALLYAYALRGAWPDLTAVLGMVLLVLGVLMGVRVFR
jgi:drug/metabolite transporter (DMT)-like permease